MFTSWIIEKNQPTNSSIELILKTPKKWNSKGWTAGQFISIQVNYGKSQIIRNYSVIEALGIISLENIGKSLLPLHIIFSTVVTALSIFHWWIVMTYN